ncbi:DUF1707 domain-containing protein [Actinokineospora soli]|uniref:DUF1707 domain-containing protein n=1 Tax=Actinokineospora soli TaxID=1048753 RepID=A0ABW2TUT8_9PSEU
MSATPWQALRIGDTDREAALRALGDHMGAGRLSVDEYGERSALVATAKTRGELAEVFTDLPEPRPHFGPLVAPVHPAHQPVYPVHPPMAPPPVRRSSGLAVAVPVAVGVALMAVFLFGFRVFPPFIVLPVVLLFLFTRHRRWH